MQRTAPTMILLSISFVAIMIATGCTASSVMEKIATGTTGEAAAAPQAASLVVKNTGTGEIHGWIASDQTAWSGNAGNVIRPGGEITLAYTPSGGSAGTPAPVYACIGRSEKVLQCVALAPAPGVLVWDGASLAPGS